MNRSSTFLLIPGVFLLVNSQANAALYAGLGIGSASSDLEASAIDSGLADAGFFSHTTLDEDTHGARIFGGYQFNDHFAVEIGYVDFGDIDSSSQITTSNPGTIWSQLEISGFSAALKADYPVNEKLAVFGKAGLFSWDAEVTSTARLMLGSASANVRDDGNDFTFGIGASYDLTEQFSLRLDWDRYNLGGDADVNVNLFSVGVQFRID